MHHLVDWYHQLSDLRGLILWGGLVALTVIIFAETGLLVGFFLPGDSLLVTAGLLASQGVLPIGTLLIVLPLAAIIGQTLGYAIGKAAGPRLFTRENSLFFKRSHLQRAHEFYERHGGKTIVLARFMPIVRTFVPVVAGVAAMDYGRFQAYNVVGGLGWVWSMLLTGYILGRYIPGIEKHIDLVIILVILLSISPGVIGWLRARRAAATGGAVPDLRTTITEE
jgi:membrane-associated protein